MVIEGLRVLAAVCTGKRNRPKSLIKVPASSQPVVPLPLNFKLT